MKSIFNTRIFRDITNVDYQKHKSAVIFRVIRYGDFQDFLNLKQIYSPQDIKDFTDKRLKELDLGEQKLLSLLYANA
ncbi:MAG: hypothetical protein M0P94_03685 [Candidatus Absconditabacterales bacterium]|nr:hypothetical protein [Candidatus Absconditabacterales bacterium]